MPEPQTTKLWRRLFGFAPEPAQISAQTDLQDPSVSADPFVTYEALRREGDVVHLPRNGLWLVVGHQAAKAVFLNPTQFSNSPYAFVDGTMLGVDPPLHGPVRGLVSRAFGGETLRRLETLATETASRLMKSELEVVSEFARPLSRAVAADLIGFDRSCLQRIETLEDELATAAAPESFSRLCAELDDVAPGAAIFSRFKDDASVQLDTEQARSLVRLLWLASTASTERTIAHSVLMLAREPRLHRQLKEEPDFIPSFVGEVTRLFPPENLIRRRAVGSVTLAGVTIPAEAEVSLCLPAVNRDPAVFAVPDELRLDRAETSAMSFGSGIHHCVGAPLTRRVVGAAITAVLRGSERLRLVGEVDWVHTMIVRAPRLLRVST